MEADYKILTAEQANNIETLLKSALREKFSNYQPESITMPFHTRLLGKDRLALYSFIHSINTNFGTTIFEPVAKALAIIRFSAAATQVKPANIITLEAQRVIQDIMDNLSAANISPNKADEIEAIRAVCQKGEEKRVKLTKVDLFLQSKENELFFIDIKTAKPNKGEYAGFKRTLLEWVAVTLHDNPAQKVNTLIAIPYNPYEPKPYCRWTIAGMLDLKNELKVAEEFWDFLAGSGAYYDILNCFERVGIELREEIDIYFSRFNTRG